ncbi:hypothetical protein [Methylobacter sp. BBA5.1]|uniref:hypothetical protein n=1 Tax=Methylobacter sp. BBA5.1 TaxID=1495064 RepID=UPI0005670E5F|nr:hypothetical protein [Methylobacter sp. BBA5.1]
MNKTQKLSPAAASLVAEQILPNRMDELELPLQRIPAIPIAPPGFVLVDVILPAHQALIAREWAELAQAKIGTALNDQIEAMGKD